MLGLAIACVSFSSSEPDVPPQPKADPCPSLPCGADCTPACPPGMMCPAVMQYCQADGTCGMNSLPDCGTIDTPCAKYKLGDACVNADNLAECESLVVGGCTSIIAMESCPLQFGCAAKYDPCEGKAESGPCSLCDPKDLMCVETMVLKTCQPGLATPALECKPSLE